VLSASDDTFITLVREQCEAKARKLRCAKKGVDELLGNEVALLELIVTHPGGSTQQGELLLPTQVSGLTAYKALKPRWVTLGDLWRANGHSSFQGTVGRDEEVESGMICQTLRLAQAAFAAGNSYQSFTLVGRLAPHTAN